MNRKKVGVVLSALLAVLLVSGVASAGVTWSTLKMSGAAEPKPWPGQWWGHRSNGIGIYQGVPGGYGSGYNDPVSPAEKLDKAMKRTKKVQKDKVTTWLTCALKAWESCRTLSDQARTDCVNKAENKAKYNACTKGFKVDTAFEWETVNHGVGYYGWDTWWGHCNAWAAAAILYPEPVKAVTWNSGNFDVGDVKGLITEVMMDNDLTSDGWHCTNYGYSSGWKSDDKVDKNEASFRDCTPSQYFNALSKYLGGLKHGVVIDRYTGSQVWNQPLASYNVTCSDAATGCPAGQQAKVCSTTFEWGEDGVGWDDTAAMAGAAGYSKRTLSFTACVQNDQLVGGDWNVPDSVPVADRWPDFIWVPGNVGTVVDSSNPYVFNDRQKIIDNLVKKAAAGATAGGTVIAEKSATVNKAIPDNNAAGVSNTIAITPTPKANVVAKSVSVCVDITHTYRGDLEVQLQKVIRGGKVALVWDNQGGGTDNIKECLAVPALAGKHWASGLWKLTVRDNAAQDVGKLNSWTLKFMK